MKKDFETQEGSQRVSNKKNPAYATKTDITMDTDTNLAYATAT